MVSAVSLVVLLTAPALAQSRDPVTADALFREARALMKKGDFATACPKLADSHRLDPAPGTAINLGDCLEKLGKLADALQAQRDALDLLAPGDKRVEPVKQQLAALEKRVPRLTIRLARDAPSGTKVHRDEVELGEGSLGTALPVNPGSHWVTVVAAGRADARTKVVLKEAQVKELHVSAGESTAAADTGERKPEGHTPETRHASTPSSETPTQKTLGYALAAVGVVGVAIGGWYWAKAVETEHTVCPSDCSNLVDQERRERKTANIGFVVGGLALAGGFVLIVSSPGAADRMSRNRVRAERGSAAQTIGLGRVW